MKGFITIPMLIIVLFTGVVVSDMRIKSFNENCVKDGKIIGCDFNK